MSTTNQDPTRDDASLLEDQLRTALADATAAQAPAFEVALLAGLRERLPGRPQILLIIDDWFEGEGAERLARELPAIRIAPRVDALLTQPDEESEDERIDALLAFDELCAGLTFCGAGQRCEGGARLVARAVRARPLVWSSLSNFASRVLQYAPPLADDPAGIVWRAIEATQALSAAEAMPPVEIIPLFRFSREPARLAASSGRPQTEIATLGAVAKVAYVESAESVELLIEVDSEDAEIAAEHEGRALILRPVVPRYWSCPAQPGLYVFTINGTPYPFEIV